MKSSEFITRSVRTIENEGTAQKRLCSSILVDGNTIYSYGYHYPLLFRIEDNTGRMIWVCNNGGYSATTAKHISWAGSHADIFARIGGLGGFFNKTATKEDVINALQAELRELESQMEGKARKDTAIYHSLATQHARVDSFLARIA